MTFLSDLWKQFVNTAAFGAPQFTGSHPGIEVDTQGLSPSVPDQAVSLVFDIGACMFATAAAGLQQWDGEQCP